MILFFDTETTGLPNNWKAPISDFENWPRLVQLAYQLFDDNGNMLIEGDYIVKPCGFSIPLSATEIHGITNEKANKIGLSIANVLKEFKILLDDADTIVAHNIDYDEKVLGCEYLRLILPNPFIGKSKICTMESSTNYCAISGSYGYKWPKLSELYYKLFNSHFEEAHNAMIDIQATSKCFWELEKRNIIQMNSSASTNYSKIDITRLTVKDFKPTSIPFAELIGFEDESSIKKEKLKQKSEQNRCDKNTTSDNLILKSLIKNLVYVKGGIFLMGATPEQGECFYENEMPIHPVSLSDFFISKYVVTQKEWFAVMGDNPSHFKGDNLPVEYVSWDDCQIFIKKLNHLTGKFFSLPTEAQWEFASRGGLLSKGYRYSGSNNAKDVAWYEENSDLNIHEVGNLRPNELGLYDMSGNVSEWCQDWYGSYCKSKQINPLGPENGSRHIYRGGSWADDAGGCRVSNRTYWLPSVRGNDLGFRLLLKVKNLIEHKMTIKNQANWLRGFLESLSISDSISKRQIEVLNTKLGELITSIEEDYDDNLDIEVSKPIIKEYNKPVFNEPDFSQPEEDDLPF